MSEANMTFENGISIECVTNKMTGEKSIGHVIFYRPLDDGNPDAISAVANINGFVPCTAVAKYLGIRPGCLIRAVTECIENQKVHVLKPCERGLQSGGGHNATPAFLLTPRPPDYQHFDESAARGLMVELLDVCERLQVTLLRMTQFCLLNSPRPLPHLIGVRKAIMNHRSGSLKRIVFDVDERCSDEIVAALIGYQQEGFKNE